MKNKLLVAVVLLIVPLLSSKAQNPLVQKVNEIKSQSDVYYWNQNTQPDAETARANALEWLVNDVNIGRSVPLTVDDLLPKVQMMNIARGSYTQVFVYLRKSDVDQTASAPAATAPTQVASPVQATPVQTTPSAAPRAYVADAFMQKIAERETFERVHSYLRALKADKQILLFGSLSQVDDIREMHLIVFDINSGQIVTILSPVKAGGERIDLLTGQADSLDNYPQAMTAVIWFMK